MSRQLPSGEQHEISAGDYRAVAVEVGGGLRELTHGGRPLLEGYPQDALADAGRGQVLAPWPNRLRDGVWTWEGRELRLALSEPTRGNASHGLVRWAGWRLESRTRETVALTHRLHAQPGYPFTLDLRIAYAVDAGGGLTVELAATNPGEQPVPVALGMHPYLAVPGGGPLDDCTLTVPAGTRVLVDDRAIPTGTAPVRGTAYDLRGGRRLGDLVLDTAYTDLEPAGGAVRVLLRGPGGDATELWADPAPGWLQVFTGDTLPTDRRRRGLAVEPMTGPANALATGEGLTILAAGETLVLRWGVRDASAEPVASG